MVARSKAANYVCKITTVGRKHKVVGNEFDPNFAETLPCEMSKSLCPLIRREEGRRADSPFPAVWKSYCKEVHVQ